MRVRGPKWATKVGGHGQSGVPLSILVGMCPHRDRRVQSTVARGKTNHARSTEFGSLARLEVVVRASVKEEDAPLASTRGAFLSAVSSALRWSRWS